MNDVVIIVLILSLIFFIFDSVYVRFVFLSRAHMLKFCFDRGRGLWTGLQNQKIDY